MNRKSGDCPRRALAGCGSAEAWPASSGHCSTGLIVCRKVLRPGCSPYSVQWQRPIRRICPQPPRRVICAPCRSAAGTGQATASPSSRGLGHRPFTAVTRVRISLGTPLNQRLIEDTPAGVQSVSNRTDCLPRAAASVTAVFDWPHLFTLRVPSGSHEILRERAFD